MLRDNTYGLMMTAAAPRLPTFLNFLKSVSVDRWPCAAPHRRGPHRTETPLKEFAGNLLQTLFLML
jgi:hypothetical protein